MFVCWSHLRQDDFHGAPDVVPPGGALLWAKGRTLLLGAPGAGTEQLLDTADASARRSAASNDRKAALTAVLTPPHPTPR